MDLGHRRSQYDCLHFRGFLGIRTMRMEMEVFFDFICVGDAWFIFDEAAVLIGLWKP